MITTVEAEWDEDTRDLVIALDRIDLCPSCGRPTYICQDAATQDAWKVPDPVRCHATTALLQRQSRVTEESNPQHMALLWRTILDEEAVGRG